MGMDDWEEKLDRKFRDIDARIDNAGNSTSTTRGNAVQSAASSRNTLSFSPPDARAFAGLYKDNEVAYFVPAETELTQIFAYVLNAPHVTANRQYAQTASGTRLVIALEDPMINAYATHGQSGLKPEIHILGGAVSFARLCGALRASTDGNSLRSLGSVWPSIGKAIAANKGNMPPEAARQLVHDITDGRFWTNERAMRDGIASSAGMLAGIFAHELGHLALGHTLASPGNLEVSRNQEREADSFASSVISTSVFCAPLVEGIILWELAWAWCESGAAGTATTHPLSRERLHDFIRANEKQAEGLGITIESLSLYLPPGM